jgi:hypothetical protein
MIVRVLIVHILLAVRVELPAPAEQLVRLRVRRVMTFQPLITALDDPTDSSKLYTNLIVLDVTIVMSGRNLGRIHSFESWSLQTGWSGVIHIPFR